VVSEAQERSWDDREGWRRELLSARDMRGERGWEGGQAVGKLAYLILANISQVAVGMIGESTIEEHGTYSQLSQANRSVNWFRNACRKG
jgi:hypothetical protein